MNISLDIKEEQKDIDTCSLQLKHPEPHGEHSYGAVHNPELKFERISEFKVVDKIEIKEELLDCDTYSTQLKPETEEEDSLLKDEEEKVLDSDLEGKIKVEELNLPASDTGPNKEDLYGCLKNSSHTSFIEVTQDSKQNTRKQMFSCKLYSSTYTSTSSIKSHTLIHENQKNTVMNKSPLKNHKKSHKCEFCGNSYTQAYNLRRHLLMHEGKKPHKCEVCGKSFTQTSHLRRHHLVHEGKKPHKCEICGKRFTRTSTLREHLLIHQGKKPHKCEVCGKYFTQTSHLRRHLLMHEGKKPYKCEVCGWSFTQASDLRRHVLLHEGKKCFTQTSTLRTHFKKMPKCEVSE